MSARSLSAFCLALGLAASCADESLESARGALERGELEAASALLAEASGAQADLLRRRIEAQRAYREARRGDLEAFRARRGDRSLAELVQELRDMRSAETDGVVREWIESELSGTAEWVDARDEATRRERERAAKREAQALTRAAPATPAAQQTEETPAPAAPSPPRAPFDAESLQDDPLLAAVLQGVHAAREVRDWKYALSQLDAASGDLPQLGVEIDAWRERLRSAASEEADALIETARAKGALDGALFLSRNLPRFPESGDLGRVARVFHELDREAEAARAQEAARAAHLEQSAEARARARQAASIAALRDALVQHWSASPEGLAAAGFDAVEERGVVARGRLRPFDELSPDEWSALCAPLRGSAVTELGLVMLRLAEGDGGALVDLAPMVERGWLGSVETSELLALFRGEEAPRGGYVFSDGAWKPRLELERAGHGARIASLAGRLRQAPRDARPALSALLAQEGQSLVLARVEHEAALSAIAARAAEVLRKGCLEQLVALAAKRAALDRARARALELIFDEQEYFYPYRGVPTERARRYVQVQREVKALVADVRELVQDTPPVVFDASEREALLDLSQLVELGGAPPRAAYEWPDELPAWVARIDVREALLRLSALPLDPALPARLAHDRAVRARNEALWEARRLDPAECEQVRITNDYRILLGRRALAWNEALQAAAEGHSLYMFETSHFAHEQLRPTTRTPALRMQCAGYGFGLAENIHAGARTALGAHEAWLESSVHHRSLLSAQATEIGVAVEGTYWTQNFGSGLRFQEDLDAWRD